MGFTEKLAAKGHLTEEQVERVGRNVRDFLAECDRNPAFFKEAMEKVAGVDKVISRTLNAMPYALVMAGASALMGGAASAGRSAVQAIRDSHAKSHAFKSMLEENPHLTDADPNITEKAFNTLYRFNPQYAQDPLVAGTFVKNIIDQERLDIGTVSNLVQARRHMAESGGKNNMQDFFMKAMQAGTRHGGGDE